MESLVEILAQYAEENLVSRILQQHAPQIRAANSRAEQLAQQLKALSPGGVDQLRNELDRVSSCREQAFLLSGISIGLKLGQL